MVLGGLYIGGGHFEGGKWGRDGDDVSVGDWAGCLRSARASWKMPLYDPNLPFVSLIDRPSSYARASSSTSSSSLSSPAKIKQATDIK